MSVLFQEGPIVMNVAVSTQGLGYEVMWSLQKEWHKNLPRTYYLPSARLENNSSSSILQSCIVSKNFQITLRTNIVID